MVARNSKTAKDHITISSEVIPDTQLCKKGVSGMKWITETGACPMSSV
jgi:hypothetical protein